MGSCKHGGKAVSEQKFKLLSALIVDDTSGNKHSFKVLFNKKEIHSTQVTAIFYIGFSDVLMSKRMKLIAYLVPCYL